MAKRYDQYCPVARSLDVMGDRWTLLIIRDMLLGKSRFREFEESLEGIPTNVLSERLKFLEAHDIVERSFYNDHPPRAEYRLTRKGKDLHWVIDALSFWGSKYTFDPPAFHHVHDDDNHPVTLAWLCVECGQTVRPSSVKVGTLAQPAES